MKKKTKNKNKKHITKHAGDAGSCKYGQNRFKKSYVFFFSGGFALFGVIIFGTICNVKGLREYRSEVHYFKSSNFHFSFAFCIIAALATISSGILFIIARRTEPSTTGTADTTDVTGETTTALYDKETVSFGKDNNDTSNDNDN
jgi:hypothetical protein